MSLRVFYRYFNTLSINVPQILNRVFPDDVSKMFLINAQRWNLNVLNMFLNRLDVITMFFKTIECSYNVPIGHILETFWKHVWETI